ncbi:BMC domain-containing protein [Clostridium sp. JN-9]|uniref:BMC domain-containing protein n=1 Tax=Clostridium sp. JN-9 TaxID=2507159 RepID=UPI000FFE2D08|nr:BMC domain-containing protein [Clostridium sp. JN-9]QAT40376.1 BMC domain-containing protein [Clostridium sp. JN-9]
MIRSIGLIELSSIAKGIATADKMLKAAEVQLIFSKPVCPGKYIILITGEVGAVKSSIASGISEGGHFIVDHLLIPNVHPDLIEAINCSTEIGSVNSVGIIEFYSIAASIIAADAAAKAAQVKLIEVRLGIGIGGKSYVTLTGNVSAVKVAVEAGANAAGDTGMFINKEVIPSPRPEVFQSLL